MLPLTASPRSSRPGSCAGRRAPPGWRSVTRCSAPSRDHDSCRHLHHCPPHISASLSSSSEAPATSSGSHSTSELSSRGHLQPLWHRRAALSACHDCDSRRRKLCLRSSLSLARSLLSPAEQSGQPRSEGFENVRGVSVPSLRPLWWASLYSRALTTICVDEVPAPRSRPTTVRHRGTGGYNVNLPTKERSKM